MVKETVLLSDEEKGEYCRKHQIYLSDLEAWGKECDEFIMRAIRENAPCFSESKPHKNQKIVATLLTLTGQKAIYRSVYVVKKPCAAQILAGIEEFGSDANCVQI